MNKNVLTAATCFWLFLSLFLVYMVGLFVPLMDQDASHHANIALHMYQQHDYVNLIDDTGKDYLDKPHLHFWLAALSFNIFGVHDFAYKLPSFLMTILAVYATYRLGRLLYHNKQVGLISALIFASSQAEILANNDVRMDALLVSGIVLAIWQLTEAAYFDKWYNYLLGAFGLAIGFTAKGMIGFIMPCIAICWLPVYQRNWKKLFNWKWLTVLILFALFIAPCLYCYYLQFDLHPEKVVRGMKHVSGVKFILWNQNFERLQGKGWGNAHKDYFFFFHTELWAFLPWSLLTYFAFIDRIAFFIKNRFRYFKSMEFLTVGTIVFIFAIISSSSYQLPHYLNVLFPIFAIITAGELVTIAAANKQKVLSRLLKVQYFVIIVILVLLVLINAWYFPLHSWLISAITFILLAALGYTVFNEKLPLKKLVIASVLTAAITNILLNGNFYPQLINGYQSGIGLSKIVKEKGIPVNSIYNYYNHNESFNFHTRHLTPFIGIGGIKSKTTQHQPMWLFTTAQSKADLIKNSFKIIESYNYNSYRVTRLTPKFLNPKTRAQTVEQDYLVRVQ